MCIYIYIYILFFIYLFVIMLYIYICTIGGVRLSAVRPEQLYYSMIPIDSINNY